MKTPSTSPFAAVKALLLFLCALNLHASERLPDIVLIVADDLGRELGAYGYPHVDTPEIDRLAAGGVRFDRAYVTAASCSPSRSTLFVGTFPHQNGQLGLAHEGYRMHPGQTYLTDYLKSAGYRTGLAGKIHINPEEPIVNKFDWEWQRNPATATTDVIATNAAVQEFLAATPAEQPFFLMLNYYDPHRHVGVPGGFVEQEAGIPEKPIQAGEVPSLPFLLMDTPQTRSQTAGYLNSILRLDYGIGLLRQSIAATGRPAPLIVFIGDHGAPFARAKVTCYEAGVAIPLIVNWPGSVKAGSVVSELTSTIDLFPSFLEAIGETSKSELPGRSLLPLLQGESVKDWRRTLLTTFHAHARAHEYPRRAVRNDRYKLIANLHHGQDNPLREWGDGSASTWLRQRPMGEPIDSVYATLLNAPPYELYDLDADPWETVNLIDHPRYQTIFHELHTELKDWQKRTGDGDFPLPEKARP